jgi:hypothetical protein
LASSFRFKEQENNKKANAAYNVELHSRVPLLCTKTEANNMGQDTEWKILAEEAAQEQDPEKLMQIIQSLTRALDDKDALRNGNGHKQDAA